MDWRRLPSLSSLRAFLAVAEKKSFSAAGRELNVTHAAISQQVRGLETHLGLQLVVRQGRGVALTPDGDLLFSGLRDGFGAISDTVDQLMVSEEARPLHVTMTPTFAVSWLMPRISDFKLKHPEIELMLNPTADLVEFMPGGIDLAIRFGDGTFPGLDAEMLLPTNYVIVGAACLVDDMKISCPEDVLHVPWLQELGANELAIWLEGQGIVPSGRLNITHLPGYMVLDGLRRGDGISATSRVFIEQEIQAGTLRVLFEDLKPCTTGYFNVTKPGVKRPPLKLFMSWLRQKAREA